MARTSGKLDVILSAVAARIIAQVTGFTAANCYVSLNPENVVPSPGQFVAVVSPLSGQFNEAYLDGGGQNQATADAGVSVRLYSPLALDEAHRDTQFLTHSAYGVLEQWRLIIKALAAWSPTSGADEIVRDPLLPAGFSLGRPTQGLGYIEQDFKFSFDLDLS